MRTAGFFICFIFSYSAFAQQISEDKVLSLDGTWDIIFDDADEGKAAEWFTNDGFESSRLKRDIVVPSCWEAYEKDYEGTAIYRKKFDVPANWEGRIVEIHFDAVNYMYEV